MKRISVVLVVAFLSACQTMPQQPTSAVDTTGTSASTDRRGSPADLYIELGTAYLQQNKLTEAFNNANKALLVDPNSGTAHNLMGVVYQRLGKEESAGEHYQRAVALEPNNSFALNALGSFLCGQEQYAEAEALFQRALRNPLYPTPWVASYNAGSCAYSSGNVAKAEQQFRAALRGNPKFSLALMKMAFLSHEKKSFMSARAYLQRYAEVADHTAESLWLGVRVERELGDEGAVANFSTLLRSRFPDAEQTSYLDEIK